MLLRLDEIELMTDVKSGLVFFAWTFRGLFDGSVAGAHGAV